MGRGVVATRYTPLAINSTSAAGMLWDIGVLGLAVLYTVLIIAFFEALKLSNLTRVPPFHRAALEASAVVMGLVGVMVSVFTGLVDRSAASDSFSSCSISDSLLAFAEPKGSVAS